MVFYCSLNLINVKRYRGSGRLEFSATAPLVRILPNENAISGERRSTRTNVAIQAIIQNKLRNNTTATAVGGGGETTPISDVIDDSGAGDEGQVRIVENTVEYFPNP